MHHRCIIDASYSAAFMDSIGPYSHDFQSVIHSSQCTISIRVDDWSFVEKFHIPQVKSPFQDWDWSFTQTTKDVCQIYEWSVVTISQIGQYSNLPSSPPTLFKRNGMWHRQACPDAISNAISGAHFDARTNAIYGAISDARSNAISGARSYAIYGAICDAHFDARSNAIYGAISGAIPDARSNAISDAIYGAISDARSNACSEMHAKHHGKKCRTKRKGQVYFLLCLQRDALQLQNHCRTGRQPLPIQIRSNTWVHKRSI